MPAKVLSLLALLEGASKYMKVDEFIEYFDEITDPRLERCKLHKLIDIIVISVLGFICGCQTWDELEDFGKSQQDWLKQFLDLPHGIPSHDTIARVFARMNPEVFQQCFMELTQGLIRENNDLIAIDGKTLRRSHDHKKNQHPLHIVSAWATKNHLTLGEVKTSGKGNELAGIEKILELIDIEGCCITIDALGCQKKIAEKIVAHGADYVLAVKGNQGLLHNKMINLFKEAKSLEYEAMVFYEDQTIDGDHGRIETRAYTVLPLMYGFEMKKQWRNLQSFIKVDTIREKGKKISIDARYYISSLDPKNAKKIGECIRHHWAIENSLHWCLDVVFNEDQSRIRKGHAPENIALIRRFALSLLKNETSFKGGMRRKQRKALMEKEYLFKILSNF